MNIISPGGGCSIHCDEELKYEVERLDGYHSEARWERTEGRRGGGAGVTSRKVRFGLVDCPTQLTLVTWICQLSRRRGPFKRRV